MDKVKVYKALKALKKNNFQLAEKYFKEVLLNKTSRLFENIKNDFYFSLNYDSFGYRSLRQIAEDIEKNWKNPYKGAVPYIKAMKNMNRLTESYYEESGKNIITNFLANSTSWKGETANRIKKELKLMLIGKTVYGLNEGTCELKKKPEVVDEKPEEVDQKEKPKKIGKKFLLTDEDDIEENEEEVVKENEDNVLVDTDNPKEVAYALRSKWSVHLEDARDIFDAIVIFKGKRWVIRFLGKRDGKYSATLNGKLIVANSITELYTLIVKAITGMLPKELSESFQKQESSITYEKFAEAWMTQKEVVSGHRPKREYNNFSVAFEFDKEDGFIKKVFENEKLRNKAISEGLFIE